MASGEFAEPIYKLLDDMESIGATRNAELILDNLVCYLDCDTIKSFVEDFRRNYDLPEDFRRHYEFPEGG